MREGGREHDGGLAMHVLATVLRAFVTFMMLPVMLAQVLVRILRRQ